jgi:hypothetical protein
MPRVGWFDSLETRGTPLFVAHHPQASRVLISLKEIAKQNSL